MNLKVLAEEEEVVMDENGDSWIVVAVVAEKNVVAIEEESIADYQDVKSMWS